MDIINLIKVIEELLELINKKIEESRLNGLCGLLFRLNLHSGDYEKIVKLMKKEFINTHPGIDFKKLEGIYWFDITNTSWYAPRIEFLQKWLNRLNKEKNEKIRIKRHCGKYSV